MGVNQFLAIDLGAESGLAVAGILDGRKLILDEVHRFPTGMLQSDDHYYWNVYRFYEEIITSIGLCNYERQIMPESIGIDTWGVDFVLLGSDETAIRIPYAYRDPQTSMGMASFLENKLPARDIYDMTGISLQPFNSIFQLNALKNNQDFALKHASHLMFMPDFLNFMLTGEKRSEFTFATTSQLLDPINRVWEPRLFKALEIDISLMSDIINPGNILAPIHSHIARNTGVNPFPVAAICSHDTASAIVAIPTAGEDWAFISSGTWSLMGVENRRPIISAKSFEYNFSNEGGPQGTFNFLKNIMGLWILQQCRKAWSKPGEEINYSDLISMALLAKPFKTFIDPDYKGFYNPEDMAGEIDSYCVKTGQEPPEIIGEYVRTILEGLAFKYRYVLDQLNEISGKTIRKIHIIGGGAQNKLLCQFTANVTGLPVIAGPVEGTAAGNILMQAMALGHLNSLFEIREVVRNSFQTKIYKPEQTEKWNTAYLKFLKFLKINP